MKPAIFVSIFALAGAAGIAGLSAFEAGYSESGVYADFSTPRNALKSYLAAVRAVNEKMEISTANRYLRYRAGRYRGFDVHTRTKGLSDKMLSYSQMVFRIRSERIWGQTAVLYCDQVISTGMPFPYVFKFQEEDGEWRISWMEAG